MQQKVQQFMIKGMQRDTSISKASNEFSFENKNIRITAREDNTLLSVTNEKGNLEIENINIPGEVLGYATINKYLVLFTTEESTDYIIRVDFNSPITSKELYANSLGFNRNNPIETLAIYENEDIQKVYWVDGINQPRMINIVAKDSEIEKWENMTTPFDATPELKLQEEVEITRNPISNGVFAPGVIQYVLTYFNKYGQESNPFYTSPLYYTSFQDRGGSPEDKVSNSFNIKVKNIDSNFDYVRVYSILRTSINATPETRKVVDLAPSISEEMILNLEDETELMHSFSSQLDESMLISGSDFELYPSMQIEGHPENITVWHLNTASYETKEDETLVIKYIIDPYSNLVLPDGSRASNYNILKLPSSNTSNSYCRITAPTILSLYFHPESVDGAYSFYLESVYKNQFSFTMGKEISYLPVYYTEYNDDGTTGEIVDPTEVLYVGGEDITAGTITQKDNTLFLGNLHINRSEVSEDIRNSVKPLEGEEQNTLISFVYSDNILAPSASGYYPYENQLKKNSQQIKGFKYLEWYRFGLQFQHKTGKWSEPIWIGDRYNTLPVKTNLSSDKTTNTYNTIQAKYTLNSWTLKYIESGEYKKVRPVIVYPNFSDRECVCQGILCPTVYNLEDRFNNSPFVQSSWFTRSINGFIGQDINYMYFEADNELEEINDFNTPSNGGIQLEFRHNFPIPGNNFRGAEIQCIWEPTKDISKTAGYFNYASVGDETPSALREWVNQNKENFYVDQSILTFHSPDIEFDTDVQNLDGEGLKLRIVGIVPITSTYGDIDIQTSTPPLVYDNADGIAPGFYKQGNIGVENIDLINGAKGLSTGVFWLDSVWNEDNSNRYELLGYAVYPFHRNGSLNNQRVPTKEGHKDALLESKKLSNLRYSYCTNYFSSSNVWKAINENGYTGISGIQIVNTEQMEQIKIKAPLYSGLDDIIYYSNIDKVINVTLDGEKPGEDETNRGILMNTKFFGYPIVASSIININTDEKSFKEIYSDKLYYLLDFNKETEGAFVPTDKQYNIKTAVHNSTTKNLFSTDPVRMKYKSTPHAVLALNYTKDGEQTILPKLYAEELNGLQNPVVDTFYYWSKGKTARSFQNRILSTLEDIYPEFIGTELLEGKVIPSYLYIAEIYNDNIVNRFGGQTLEALENNMWLPCGEPVSIYNINGILKNSLDVYWTEGDTYYQRYDHIKTYPFTLKDQNCITDIVSFMCETRVNLDGRYDRNRGNLSNFTVTQENFNQVNEVYSQSNNFFVYRALNYNKFSLDDFPNSITWTKEKQLGELVDTWTHITSASTLDLDGEKGEVSSLNTFNNEVFAFQKHGISHILFNSRVQIPASDGVPIEITNGLKVEGKRYMSEVGCHNKWAITTTPNGIYFVDNITNGIYLFTGEGLEPISEKLGFGKWVEDNSSMELWNNDYSNFRTFYDKVNGDVYFTTKDTSLCFSESLGQFTSFMDYEKLPAMFNVDNSFYTINKGKLWKQNAGDYNYFFGEYKPYSIEYRVSPDPYADKTFTNIEFRADTFDDNTLTNETFNKLTVYNEYQNGEVDLQYHPIKPSTLKKKFRMWRAFIPRDKNNNRDRIRNPWINLKLERNIEDTHKTELHDLLVYYYD